MIVLKIPETLGTEARQNFTMMNNGYYSGMVGASATTGSSVHEDEIEKIINEVKSQGVFDEFRRDCISDVDTKVCDH